MLILIVLAVISLSHPESGERTNHPKLNEIHAQSQTSELTDGTELSKTVVKLYSEGKYQDALPLAKRVVEIREQSVNQDIQLIRSAYLNLAELYVALGKYGDAESAFERVVESYRKLNANDVRLADVLTRMALVQVAMTDTGKAEAAYKESLRLKETALGSHDPATIKSLQDLAEFYHFKEDYDKAIPYYRRLLPFHEKAKGPKQKGELATVVDRYACALRKVKKEDEASALEDRMFSLLSDPLDVRGKKTPTDARSGKTAMETVLNGRAVSMPRPAYPEEARLARAAGTVTVRVVIDEKGNVVSACAMKGPQLLFRTSELAAYQAKFTPTTLSGQPITVTGMITYNYVRR